MAGHQHFAKVRPRLGRFDGMLVPRLGDGWAEVAVAVTVLVLAASIGVVALGAYGGLVGVALAVASEVMLARRRRQYAPVIIEVPKSIGRDELREKIRMIGFGEPATILVEGPSGQPEPADAVRCERRHVATLMTALGLPC